MHTQAEAKTKWCPEARVKADPSYMGSPTINRNERELTFTECIASKCMHWRWGPAAYTTADASVGYCGLSGTPR